MAAKPKIEKPVVYLGTDHAGKHLKDDIKDFLVAKGYHVHDLGALENDPNDDYPDFVFPACEAVAKSKGGAVGIVFGGSGIGEAIAANKVPGIRAALVYDTYGAKMCRQHNDANVLSLGGRTATGDTRLAKKLVTLFLTTPFSGDVRHKRRIKKISTYERQ